MSKSSKKPATKADGVEFDRVKNYVTLRDGDAPGRITLTSIELTTAEGQPVKLGIAEARSLYAQLHELYRREESLGRARAAYRSLPFRTNLADSARDVRAMESAMG